MALPRNPIVVIPARLASTRLPDKPLADIGGVPMIVHVWRRAVEADVGPVVVAAADGAIAEAVEAAGGRAVLTDPAHPSGSDRVHEAVNRLDPDRKYDGVVNLQGDLPTLEPTLVHGALAPLATDEVAIGTLVAEITDEAERDDPGVVKAVLGLAPGTRIGRALYFSRSAVPWGDGPLYHHIGIYAWRRTTLDHFVALAPGVLERRERLEQLRALEAGLRLDAALVDTLPLGVDTPADLVRARALLGAA